MIQVTNNTSKTVSVAINQWGSDGDTTFSPLNAGKGDSWNRTDPRGFVMVVQRAGAELTYFVQAESTVVITDSAVYHNGLLIQPIALA